MSMFTNLHTQDYFLFKLFLLYLELCYNLTEGVNHDETTLIGIAGGTAGGKTTIASKVFKVNKFGSVVVIRLDDYKDMSNLELSERTKISMIIPILMILNC